MSSKVEKQHDFCWEHDQPTMSEEKLPSPSGQSKQKRSRVPCNVPVSPASHVVVDRAGDVQARTPTESGAIDPFQAIQSIIDEGLSLLPTHATPTQGNGLSSQANLLPTAPTTPIWSFTAAPATNTTPASSSPFPVGPDSSATSHLNFGFVQLWGFMLVGFVMGFVQLK